ncbi:hypothetical protein GCM10022216_18690 [Sphingobacterium kyonggiense]|uniref:Outer membrane protein TolC n=1 Tax=Sphingobacterium kyonggiense TaxID=714075 RepID=A0ABP7YQZ4_9SPHI
MKRVIIYIFAILLLPGYSLGQSLSIEELWQQAKTSIGSQQKDVELASKRQEELVLRNNRLPLVYGDVNLQRNIIIPTTPVPAIAFDPNAQEGAILPLKFATKWNSRAGVQLEWDIFNPSKNADLNKARIETKRAILNQELALIQWKKDATLAYCASVLASEQYKLALEDSITQASLVKIMNTRFEEGREKQTDLFAAFQEMERKIIQRHEAWSVLMETDLDLRKMLANQNLTHLSSDLSSIQNLLEKERFPDQQLELLQLDQQLATYEIRETKLAKLPTITLNGFFGAQFFSNEFDLFERNHWYGNSFANIGVKIPISAYFTNSASVKKSQLQEQLTVLKIREQEIEEATKDKKTAAKIWSAKQKIAGLERIVDLAEKEKNLQLEGVQIGRTIPTEYYRANHSWIAAKKELWQAEFDLVQVLLKQ